MGPGPGLGYYNLTVVQEGSRLRKSAIPVCLWDSMLPRVSGAEKLKLTLGGRIEKEKMKR